MGRPGFCFTRSHFSLSKLPQLCVLQFNKQLDIIEDFLIMRGYK